MVIVKGCKFSQLCSWIRQPGQKLAASWPKIVATIVIIANDVSSFPSNFGMLRYCSTETQRKLCQVLIHLSFLKKISIFSKRLQGKKVTEIKTTVYSKAE